MRLYLAPGVHAAQVADDLVFLDTAADAYFCLGGGAELITLGPGGQIEVGQDGPALQLVGAGLLSQSVTCASDRMPPRPIASAHLRRGAAVAVPAAAALDIVTVTLSVARDFGRHSFSQLLLGPAPKASAWENPSPALFEAVAQFEKLRPWLPLHGECLLRSFHLRAFLRRRGLDALWVFGVRTWPFGAHCWLQAGETALDEDLERLSAYQPIMAA